MTSVAVIAHSRKQLGGGLSELRAVLGSAGVTDPLWYEVPKSKQAPKQARKALKDGAHLVFVCGGDGMVQRCVDALAGKPATLAIIPAETANLLATNLGIPPGTSKWPSRSGCTELDGSSTSASRTASGSPSWREPVSTPS